MVGYLDPGMGSLVVQSVVIGCLTVVAVFRDTVKRMFSWVVRLFRGKR